MVIFGAIDGTGVWNDDKYEDDYRNSFVNRAYRKFLQHCPAFYHRGSTVLGGEVPYHASLLVDFVRAQHNAGPVDGIILAGHSRGGASAVVASQILMTYGYSIDYLFLFDAVNMIPNGLAHIVPPNVKHTIHARRDPLTNSRWSWGNCGTWSTGQTYQEQFFFCTHAGVGGVPAIGYIPKPERADKWYDYVVEYNIGYGTDNVTRCTYWDDKIGSEMVQAYMFPKMRQAFQALNQQPPAGSPAAQPYPGNNGPGNNRPGGGNGGGGGNGNGSRYTVVSGDSLSLISGRYWGDVLLWPILYDANKQVVGPDPNKIVPGQKLTVPDIKAYSPQQISSARSRGQNWA